MAILSKYEAAGRAATEMSLFLFSRLARFPVDSFDFIYLHEYERQYDDDDKY